MNLQFMKMQILELGLHILAAYIGGLIARKLKIGEVVGQIFVYCLSFDTWLKPNSGG